MPKHGPGLLDRVVPKGLNSSHAYDFGSSQVTSGRVVKCPPLLSGE